MSPLGKSVGRLARATGGQLLLELPDDLPPEFVGSIVKGVNSEFAQKPPFCLLVHDRRRDLPSEVRSIDFRELAMYRQGGRLAVAFASDNRSMSTYSSVYPLLFAPGFPGSSSAAGPTGVVSLNDLIRSIVTVLAELSGGNVPMDELLENFSAAANFLTAAYLYGDNGQTSAASDWWLHLSNWIEALAEALPKWSGQGITALIYGSAGLPAPNGGSRMTMRPRDYVEVLRARWGDAAAVRKELLRLEGLPSAATAAAQLSTIDWEQETSATLLQTDSQIRRVALAGFLTQPAARITGWANLTEEDFRSSYVDAKGKLALELFGAPLPRPWEAAFPVLFASAESCNPDGSICVGDVGILIPWKQGMPDVPGVSAQVVIKGLRGSVIDFKVESQEIRNGGLLLLGQLDAKPANKSPSILTLEAEVTGAFASLLADRSDCMVAVVRASEAVLQVRRTGKKSAGPKNAFERWPQGAPPAQIKLGSPGAHELALAVGEAFANRNKATAGLIEFAEGWPGSTQDGLLTGRGDLSTDISVSLDDIPIFDLTLSKETRTPLSPIVAAASGMLPDYAAPVERVPLGFYDQEMLTCLREFQPGSALGAFLTATSREGDEFVDHAPGVWVQAKLTHRLQDLYPSIPSSNLLGSPEYQALANAYLDLGFDAHIADLESVATTSGITPSRIAVTFIPEDKIEALLGTYAALVQASKPWSRTDQFWAKHPFSIANYPDGIGSQSLEAILLSPLHPIRLAWLWRVQVGLRAAYDDGIDPAQALTLLDASLFPASTMLSDEFDQQVGYMPLAIDAYPYDIYRGWQALVRIADSRPRVPRYVNGDRFPVDGLSGLSPAAVSGAVDDFMRVSPHVQALKIDLEAAEPIRRSTAIDDGIIEKIEELSRSSNSLDGVGGVTVIDSPRRQGPIPSFQGISEALDLARGAFNVTWHRRPEYSPRETIAESSAPHLTFLEGLPATLALVESDEAQGWIPKVPLRRFPVRKRPPAGGASLAFALPADDADTFCAALGIYEGGHEGGLFELRIKPNLAALPQRPNWLVAGDFGVDPQSIAAASAAQGAGRYMLWDWRPATTVRAGDQGTSMRAQPYFIVASVPPALTAAIAARVQKLKSGLVADELEGRVRQLVQTLATRAVGLNTLLAVGHHQATGALGFYFALRSLLKWMDLSPAGEIRLVVPIDAVDPFLRSVSAQHLGNKRRADLLAISAKIDGNPQVTLIPIEIKHYGLTAKETATAFPTPDEKRLAGHLDQLRTYQEQLVQLVATYDEASGARASVIGQQLAAILEAAIQLSPKPDIPGASKLLSSIAGGEADLSVGKGLLLWFQPGATREDGSKAAFEETYGPLESRRIDVWIDPAAHDAEYWDAAPSDVHVGGAHHAVLEALNLTVDIDTEALGSFEASTLPETPMPSDEGAVDLQHAAKQPEISTVDVDGNLKTKPTMPEESAAPVAGIKRLSTQDLEKVYLRLLKALGEFNVSVQRPDNAAPYEEGPAFMEFAIRPAYGVSVSKIEAQLENVKLRLGLPAEATIGCANHLGNVLLTVPKDDQDRYFITTHELWARWDRPGSGFHIPLGEDIKGQIVSLEFSSSNSPHLLIAGVTGSGKSEALLTLLHGAAHFYSADELEFRLVDPKQTELVSLESLPHCQGDIGWSAEDAVQILSSAADEMDTRYELFRQSKVRDIEEYKAAVGPMRRVLIVLDEYADLTTDDDERKQIEKQLKRLAQKARAAGIHVIVSTQKPVVQVVNTVIKGNLPARVALRVNNGGESRIILDENGAEQLSGKGDALLKAGSRKVRLQFARYDPE